MADEARCTPLHPENMDATCSDVRELLAPTSFHVVHGGCASPLNVDRALIGALSLDESANVMAADAHCHVCWSFLQLTHIPRVSEQKDKREKIQRGRKREGRRE